MWLPSRAATPSLPPQVVVMYVGPLLVGLGVTVQSSDWELGYFTRVAQIVSSGAAGWCVPLKAISFSASTCFMNGQHMCTLTRAGRRQLAGVVDGVSRRHQPNRAI